MGINTLIRANSTDRNLAPFFKFYLFEHIFLLDVLEEDNGGRDFVLEISV